jgi:LAS superfamily LD-carboxypeptidase LdcB
MSNKETVVTYDQLTLSSLKGAFDFSKIVEREKMSNPEYQTVYSSAGAAAKEKVINGKVYKNGNLSDLDLLSISPDLLSIHRGDISSDNGRIRLFPDAMRSLSALLVDSMKAGVKLHINSAYRTFEDQVNVKKIYGDLAATPGFSNHGFGLAVDFATPSNRKISISDKEYDWLITNAERYAFRRIKTESWHWEYQIGASLNQGVQDD